MHDTSNLSLRLFLADDGAPVVHSPKIPARFTPICNSLEDLSGWKLGYEASSLGASLKRQESLTTGIPKGRFYVEDMSERVDKSNPALSRPKLEKIADDLSSLANEVGDLKNQLRQCHAMLSVSSVTRIQPTDADKLALLFEKLLINALQIAGFESAAIATLDPTSGQITFRYGHGVHFAEEIGVVRPLRNCKADLEALTGSLIVLNKKSDLAIWEVPVECRSAICLPISSTNNLLGTLWLTTNKRKDLSDMNGNILEIIAGRVATELERVALLEHLACQSRPEAESWEPENDNNTSDRQPPFTDWKVENRNTSLGLGSAEGPKAVWRVTSDDHLAIVAMDLRGPHSLEQFHALSSAFQILNHFQLNPDKWLAGFHHFLSQRFDASNVESLACLQVDPLTGEIRGAASGDFGFLLTGPNRTVPPRGLEFNTNQQRQSELLFLPRQSELTICHPYFDLDEFCFRLNRH